MPQYCIAVFLHLRPDQVSPDIVPAKADIVAVIGVCAQPQQFALDVRTSEAIPCILVVSVSEIPEDVVAAPIYKVHKRPCLFTRTRNLLQGSIDIGI